MNFNESFIINNSEKFNNVIVSVVIGYPKCYKQYKQY